MYYPEKVGIRPHKETNYNYKINIGGLEGIEQDFNDGWNLN